MVNNEVSIVKHDDSSCGGLWVGIGTCHTVEKKNHLPLSLQKVAAKRSVHNRFNSLYVVIYSDAMIITIISPLHLSTEYVPVTRTQTTCSSSSFLCPAPAALQSLMSGLLLVVGVQSHVIAVTCVIDLEWIYLSIHHLHHSPNRFLNHIFFLLASHRLLQSLLNFTIYDYTRTRHGHCHSHWLAATNYRITISLFYWTVVGLKSALEILSQFTPTFCCMDWGSSDWIIVQSGRWNKISRLVCAALAEFFVQLHASSINRSNKSYSRLQCGAASAVVTVRLSASGDHPGEHPPVDHHQPAPLPHPDQQIWQRNKLACASNREMKPLQFNKLTPTSFFVFFAIHGEWWWSLSSMWRGWLCPQLLLTAAWAE